MSADSFTATPSVSTIDYNNGQSQAPSSGNQPGSDFKSTTSDPVGMSSPSTNPSHPQLDPSYDSGTGSTQYPMQQPTDPVKGSSPTVVLATTDHFEHLTVSDKPSGTMPTQLSKDTLTAASMSAYDVSSLSSSVASGLQPTSVSTVSADHSSTLVNSAKSDKNIHQTVVNVDPLITATPTLKFIPKSVAVSVSKFTDDLSMRTRSSSRMSPMTTDSYVPSTGQVLEPITASKTVYSQGTLPPHTRNTFTATPAPPVTPNLKPVDSEQSTILGGGLSDYIVYVGIPACGLLLLLLILCVCCICCRKKKNKGSPSKPVMQDLWVNSQPEISLSTRQPLIEAPTGMGRMGHQQGMGCTTYEAVFDFQAETDTHLSLHQGDRVTVVRKETNGWWRGTVDDHTGWFPSSYVQAAPQDKLETENEVEMHNDSQLSSFMVIQRPHSLRDSYPTEEEIGAEPIYCKIQPKDKRKSDIQMPERTQPKPVEPVMLKDNKKNKLAEDTKFIAIYSYEAKAPGELNLSEGDLILGKEQDSNGWTNGLNETTKEEGWFPSVYVDKLDGEVREVAAEPGSYQQLEVNTRAGNQPWLGIVHKARHSFTAEKAGDLEFRKDDLITVLQVLENGWWLGCKDKSVGWFPGTFVKLLDQPPSPIDPGPPTVAPPTLGPTNVPDAKLTPANQKKSRLRPARKAPPPPPKADSSTTPASKIPALASSKIPKTAEKISSPGQDGTSLDTMQNQDSSAVESNEPKLLTSDGLYELIPNAEEKANTEVKKPSNKPKIPVRYIKPRLVQIPRHEVELPNVSSYNRDSLSCELSPPQEHKPPDQLTPPDVDGYYAPLNEVTQPTKNPTTVDTYQDESEAEVADFFHLPPQKLVSPFRQESVDDEPESPPYRAFSSFGSSFGKKDAAPSVRPVGIKTKTSPVFIEQYHSNVPQPQAQALPVQENDEMPKNEEDLCDEVFREIRSKNKDAVTPPPPPDDQKPVSKIPTSPKSKDKPEKPVSRLQPPKHINLSQSTDSDTSPVIDTKFIEPVQKKDNTTPVSKIPKLPSVLPVLKSKEHDINNSQNISTALLADERKQKDSDDIDREDDMPNDFIDDSEVKKETFEKFVNQGSEIDTPSEKEEINFVPKPKIVPKPSPKPKPDSVINGNPAASSPVDSPPVSSPIVNSQASRSLASTPDSLICETPPSTPSMKDTSFESGNESDSKTKDKPKGSKLPLGSKIAQKSPQLRGRKSKIPASPKLRPKNSEHQENIMNMNKNLETEKDTQISSPVIHKQKPASLQLRDVQADVVISENERNLRNRSSSPQDRPSGIPTNLRNRSNSPSASKIAKPLSLPGSPATPTSKQSSLVAPKKVSNGMSGRQSPASPANTTIVETPEGTKSQIAPSPDKVLELDHSDQLSPKPNRPSKPPKIPTQKGKDGKAGKPSGKSLLPMVQKSIEGGSGLQSPNAGSKLPKRTGIPTAKPPRPPPPKSQQETEEDLSPKKSLFQAVKGYTAQCDGELSFSEGTFIVELSDCDRKGWYMGMLADGTTGLYPGDHFQPSPVTAMQTEA